MKTTPALTVYFSRIIMALSVIVLFLSSCKPGTNEGSTSTHPAFAEPAKTALPLQEGFTSTPPNPAEPTKTPGPPEERVKILWVIDELSSLGWNYPGLAARDKIAADFNAAQDEIELEVRIINEFHLGGFASMIAQGNAPDISGPPLGGWGYANQYYGQWLDLTPYIESTGFDTSIYEPALIDHYRTDEGQVALPFQVFPYALYYVPAMFDQAGLAYPPNAYGEQYILDGAKVEWNWDTLAEVAKRLTLDINGKNATEHGFDAAQIAQIGFTFQWQTHVAYQGTFISGAADIVSGDGPGRYKSAMPESWKEANRWIYEGMWGEQPFIANGPLSTDPEFGDNNLFGSGKAAMALAGLWYTCCLEEFRDAGFTFDAGILPVGADGKVHGRVDGETFRLWKGTRHPEEAFKVLTYFIGPGGTQTLLIGEEGVEPKSLVKGLPAHPAYRQAYIDDLLEQYPFTTAETWDVFLAGLSYPDTPSAEQWQPRWSESWERQRHFSDLMQNTHPDQFDFNTEWQRLVDDLNSIYEKY